MWWQHSRPPGRRSECGSRADEAHRAAAAAAPRRGPVSTTRHDERQSLVPSGRLGEMTTRYYRLALLGGREQPRVQGCLVQVGNGIELEAVGFRFEPYRWRPCGVTWDSSRTVVVIKLRRTSALLTTGAANIVQAGLSRGHSASPGPSKAVTGAARQTAPSQADRTGRRRENRANWNERWSMVINEATRNERQ